MVSSLYFTSSWAFTQLTYPDLALAGMGKQHGATIVVSGHSHIPLSLTYDEVLLVNPSAVANAGFTVRQNIPSIAILELPSREVTYYETKTGAIPAMPKLDISAGFAAARNAHMTGIITQALKDQLQWLKNYVYPLSPEPFRSALRTCAARCWRFEAEMYGIPELCKALREREDVPEKVFEMLYTHEAFAPYL